MAEAPTFLKQFQLNVGDSGVIEHGGAETDADVTDDLVPNVALASHRAQAVKALSSGSVPNAAVAQLERNNQRVVSGGGAAPVTSQDLAASVAALRVDFAAFRGDLAALRGDFTGLKADITGAIDQLSKQMLANNRNQFARLQNSQAGDSKPYLALVREKPAEAGSAALGAEPPAAFPGKKDDLTTISGPNITVLAQHYGEEFAGANVVERRRALARFMGVQW